MTLAGTRRALKQIGALRLVVTAGILLLALLVARMSWTIPLAMDAERALYDVRQLVSAPRVDQDNRIVMVVFTEETLTATGKRFPLDRGLLARALKNLDALGPKAIGVDILIDQAQAEDDQLAASLAGMKTPTYLAYASNDTNATFMQPWQQAFLQTFLGRLDGSATHPASIRLEADPDNVMRSWPSQPPGLPPLLANAMAPDRPGFGDYEGRIRFRQAQFADRPVFASLPIDLFGAPESAAALKSMIAGRHVLVGADIPDIDRFETPATRLSKASVHGLETGATISGLEVHANLLAQLLDGWKPTPVPPLILWLAAFAVVALGALTGIADMPAWRTGVVLVLQLALLLVLPFILQARGVDTDGVPMFGWATGWILSFSSVGAAARAIGSQERRFAQSALGKYLPRDIAAQILREPEKLALHGEQREIFVIFTDLEGFTEMTHGIAPALVAQLLNRYLDMLSATVLEYGGTLDKFVGDSIIAFWGAPIARADDGERAARCALALYETGQRFRAEAPAEAPPIGRTRVGLHLGEAIVGNFGGEDRIQYTALGDAMNTASRLEAANKVLKTRALISREAADRCTIEGLRAMGRILVRGRSTPIEVFEINPDCPQAVRTRLNAAYIQFDAGDVSVLDDIAKLAKELPDDLALADLAARLKSTGPGGSYVLN